jgi:hypothetical protein
VRVWGSTVGTSGPDLDDLGWANRAGCDIATHPFVAFTDAWTMLLPRWRAAAAAAIAADHPLIGGPVLPPPLVERRDIAGWISEYACHAVPPHLSQSGDVAACNVLYARPLLAASGPIWKSVVNRGLRSNGVRPYLQPDMCVVHDRPYGRDLSADRFAAGRRYGQQLSHEFSHARRGAGCVAATALPALMVARSWSTCSHDRELRRLFRRGLGSLVVAHCAWSLGEAIGLALGSRS